MNSQSRALKDALPGALDPLDRWATRAHAGAPRNNHAREAERTRAHARAWAVRTDSGMGTRAAQLS